MEYANAIVTVELPRYFYVAWLATGLVPAKKFDPSTLPPGADSPARPINIGNTEHRLITCAYFDADLQDAYNGILGPVQKGCIVV